MNYKFNKRMVQIIDVLIKEGDVISSNVLAKIIGVSSKTIKKDIIEINKIISAYNCEILGIMSKGFIMEYHCKDSYHKLLNNLDNTQCINYLDDHNRTNYLVIRILENSFEKNVLSYNNLADEIFIAYSTLKRDLIKVRVILNKYNIILKSHNKQGLKVIGQENDIRRCLSYSYKEMYRGKYTMSFYQEIFPGFSFKDIVLDILDVLKQFDYQASDESINSLALHLIIAIKRLKNNNEIKTLIYKESNKVNDKFEFMARQIIEVIQNKYDVLFNKYEIQHFSYRIEACQKNLNYINTNIIEENNEISIIYYEILNTINEQLKINLYSNLELKYSLMVHLEVLLKRIESNSLVESSMVELMKDSYPLAFQLGVISALIIEQYTSIYIEESEIAYLAMHFGAALSKSDLNKRIEHKKAIIVCPSGIGMTLFLKTRIEKNFKNQIRIIKVVRLHSVTPEICSEYDIVFTTVPLPHVPQYNVLFIKQLLNDDELLVVKEFIDDNNMAINLRMPSFFKEDLYFKETSFNNKDELLKYLTTMVYKKGYIDKETIQSIIKRERLASTEIGRLIAIPHPIVNTSLTTSISVLVLDKPLLWDTCYVQVVFLISVNKKDIKNWESIVLKLTKFLTSNNRVEWILKNNSYDLFIKEIIK